MTKPNRPGQRAVQTVEAVADPVERAGTAAEVIEDLRRVRDEAMSAARAAGATLAVVAARLGTSAQYVDRTVRGAGRGIADRAAYAFTDTSTGQLHGPDALPAGDYSVGTLEFNPASPSPFAGRTLEVRYGPWASTAEVNVYVLHLADPGGGRDVVVRDTHELHAILFPGRA